MKFAPDTQTILDRVENITKTPIQFVPELDSPYLLAQFTPARGGAQAHLLRYKSEAPGVNYLIAFQAAFIVRLYENPPDERFEFGASGTGLQSVLTSMKGPGGIEGKLGITGTELMGLARQMYDGVMLQVRSMPIGMRIDDWLFRDYPGLRGEQEASIASQQQTNVKSLSPAARTIAPPTIYNANVSMCTAYALFADRLYQQNLYTIPFHSAGFSERGQQLMDIFDSIPDDPTNDRRLVTACGEELGISDWFQWLPMTGAGDER